MTNLKEEIRKAHLLYICEDEDCVGCNEEIDKIISLFRQTMLEIIGEDEKTDFLEHKVWRNILRAEQRERVKKIIG